MVRVTVIVTVETVRTSQNTQLAGTNPHEEPRNPRSWLGLGLGLGSWLGLVLVLRFGLGLGLGLEVRVRVRVRVRIQIL